MRKKKMPINKSGMYFGNPKKISGNMILTDRKTTAVPNPIVFGQSGKGMAFYSKVREIGEK